MGSWGGAGVVERQNESLPCRLYYYFLSSCSCNLPKVLACSHTLTCLHYHPHTAGFITRKSERTHDGSPKNGVRGLVTCLSPSPCLSEVPLLSTPEHKAAESIS